MPLLLKICPDTVHHQDEINFFLLLGWDLNDTWVVQLSVIILCLLPWLVLIVVETLVRLSGQVAHGLLCIDEVLILLNGAVLLWSGRPKKLGELFLLHWWPLLVLWKAWDASHLLVVHIEKALGIDMCLTACEELPLTTVQINWSVNLIYLLSLAILILVESSLRSLLFMLLAAVNLFNIYERVLLILSDCYVAIARNAEEISWLLGLDPALFRILSGGISLASVIFTTISRRNRRPRWKSMLGVWSRCWYHQMHLLLFSLVLMIPLFLQVFRAALLHKRNWGASRRPELEDFEVWRRQKLLALILRECIHITPTMRWKLWMIRRCFRTRKRQLFLNERLFVAVGWGVAFLLSGTHFGVLHGCLRV